MIQDAVVCVIVALAAVWPLRAWLLPPLRRVMAQRRGQIVQDQGRCGDCGCGR